MKQENTQAPEIGAVIKLRRDNKNRKIIVSQNGKKVSEVVLKDGEKFEGKEKEIRDYYTKFVEDVANKMLDKSRKEVEANKERLRKKYAGFSKEEIFGSLYWILSREQKDRTKCKEKKLEVFHLEDQKDFYVILTSLVGVEPEPEIWLEITWKDPKDRSEEEQEHRERLSIDSYLLELIEHMDAIPVKSVGLALTQDNMKKFVSFMVNRERG